MANITKLPVEERHKAYDAHYVQWKRCRDVALGMDSVHAAGVEYLPKLADQTDPEYKAYKMRAGFFNASWRTIVGLQGMLFRQPPKIVVPSAVEPLLEDIDLKGTPFVLQLIEVAEEALKIGRVGLLVDFPIVSKEDETRMTQADAGPLNLRPTIGVYKAESIINWQSRVIDNRTVLSQVRLEENVAIRESEFKTVEEKRWRVLDLDATNTYRVRIFRKNDRGEQEQVGTDVWPEMGGKNLDYIPFYFIGVDDNTWECDAPPLIDLVDLNLGHYRVSADYEHGCHFTGLPTPYIAGHRAKENEQGVVIEKFNIGSTTAWVFGDPLTKVGFLEFSGQGLEALRLNLEDKKKDMAVLGARMLEALQKQVEAADTAAIHRGGENSMLSSVAQSISIGVRRAMLTFCRWAGADVPEDDSKAVEFELNRDFFPVPMDSNELNALVNSWQKGAISYESLFDNLQRREVVPKDVTAEEEQDKIEAEGPKLGSMPLGGMPGALMPGALIPGALIPGAPGEPKKTKKVITKTDKGFELEEKDA